MFRTLLSASAVLVATTTVVAAQEASVETVTVETLSEEALAWDAVKDSTVSAEVFAFIERFPSGEFTTQAQALMIDLLWAEMAAAEAAPDTTEATTEGVLTVTFSSPLTQGSPEIVGKSLEELIAGSPLFPPVEGLPASYWETQECSACHQWEQANLCTQANTYLTDAGAESMAKEHPYGGTFKENLQSWALAGCE